MIEIKLDNKVGYLEIKGHANFDEQGKDIVCAGISTISMIVEKYLSRNGNYEITTDKGYFKGTYDPKNMTDVLVMLFVIEPAIVEFVNNYPDYITYEVVEGEEDGKEE